MIHIAKNIQAHEGFLFYVDDVRVLNGTSPVQSEIQVIVVDDVAGHVIPFGITVSKSSPTITWAENYLLTQPWAQHGTLIDKLNN